MSNSDETNTPDSTEKNDTSATASPSSNYKTRGKQDAPDGTGVLGYNTAPTGAAHGVEGIVESDVGNSAGVRGDALNGSGVYGSSTDGDGLKGTSNSGRGMYARSEQSFGAALYTNNGDASGVFVQNLAGTNVSDEGYGVEARTQATGAGSAGIYGEATQGNGVTYGVNGVTASADNRAAGINGGTTDANGSADGVRGLAVGDGDGVYGESRSGGTGVRGAATDTGTLAYGVEGTTQSSVTDAAGVRGEATQGSGQTYGVYGTTQSDATAAAAVRADAAEGRGVYSTTTGGDAFFGLAETGIGIVCQSSDSRGAQFTTLDAGRAAVWARSSNINNPSGAGYGVEGRARGSGTGTAGVYGEAENGTGQNYGVDGVTVSSGTDAAGVRGRATENSGQTYGVYGETQSDDFQAAGIKALGTDTHGIRAETTGQTRNGVYGIASSGSGFNFGVRADCNSTDPGARGLKAKLTNSSATGVAVEGVVDTSSAHAAVQGDAPDDVPAVEALGRLTASATVSGGANTLTDHVAAISNTEPSDGFNHVMALEMPNISGPAEGNNFLTFLDSTGPIGAIEGSSGGIKLDTAAGDFAEYFPLADPETDTEAGTVLGLESGELVADADGAEAALVVTRDAAITGKNPDAGEGSPDDHECVALLGQVPVKVAGAVDAGNLLVAAGDGRAESASGADPSAADAPVVGRALESVAATDSGSRTVEAFVGRASTAGSDDENVEQLRAELARKEETIEQLEDRLDDLEAAVEQLASGNPRPASADD